MLHCGPALALPCFTDSGIIKSHSSRADRNRRKDQMLIQIVKASIKPEECERWVDVVRHNAKQTRAEDGCIAYQVAEDLEKPNDFVIVELWNNLDAVYVHFRTQFAKLMAALDGVFAAPPEAHFHDVDSTLTLDQVLTQAGVRL